MPSRRGLGASRSGRHSSRWKGRQPNSRVPRELIQADRQAARVRPHQIDFHQHGHRPSKPLVDAEQRIGGDDPAPARRPHQHERHRQPDGPPQHERMLTAPALGQLAGDQVGQRLHHAEADDEAGDDAGRLKVESFGPDQRHHRAFEADHSANKRVQKNQEKKLTQVGANAERDTRGPGRVSSPELSSHANRAGRYSRRATPPRRAAAPEYPSA